MQAPLPGFNTLARCGRSKHPFGLRFSELLPKIWVATWSFRLDDKSAQGEVSARRQMEGTFGVDPTFRGCPWCGAKGFFKCGGCGKLTCLDDSQKTATCRWCQAMVTMSGTMDKSSLTTDGVR